MLSVVTRPIMLSVIMLSVVMLSVVEPVQNLDGCQNAGNTKGRSITVLLISSLTGLELTVRKLTIFVFIFKTD